MKKYFYLLVITLLSVFSACKDDDNDSSYTTYIVTTQLIYPEASGIEPIHSITITLYDTSNKSYASNTDENGKASFNVPAGVYRAVANDSRYVNGQKYSFNGAIDNIAVTNSWDATKTISLTMDGSVTGQIVIKELYVGGCPKDDGSGAYINDKYVILYNNSDQPVTLNNLCLGMVLPYNAHGNGNSDYESDRLKYEGEGWIPAGNGIWYFPNNITIEAGKQIVVALNNAIDNTQTYSKSINFSNSDYYCTYDMSAYPNTSSYSVPSTSIPASHYWSAARYGKGNAWPLSAISPAFFVFTTNESPTDFANNTNNTDYYGGTINDTNIRKKVPVENILDAVEVFTTTSDKNLKRLTASVDVGQTYLTNKLGYSSYRNVDKKETEAIAENAGKLVYSYSLGTDPSGIDAEASLKNGARIVYKDTNNSTNDFHQRAQASLRD